MSRESCVVDLVLGGITEHVKVKVVKDADGKVIRVKPEYDDLKRLAEKTKKPLRELAEMAVSKAREIFIQK